MSSPVPTKLPEQVTKNKGKNGKFSQKVICNISAAIYILSYLMAEGAVFPSVHRLTYQNRVCAHRTGLCCPLVLAELPTRCRRPRTGLQICHRSSVQVVQCMCSCCCCPTAPWCVRGCCQSYASKPAESYCPSCRAWPPKDSKGLGNILKQDI